METDTILLVDDNAENLRVLKSVLDRPGRDVRAATSGPPALALAQKIPIDLILLDINMPGLDGYEVCRRLKASEGTRDIPVLFLSANTETENIVQGFNLGGADYITKPFEIAEVEARVETHLQISRLRRQLARHNQELEAVVRARTAQLREAHAKLARLDAAKDDFFRLISHEVRTPLNGMVALEIALEDLSAPDPLAEAHALFLQSFRRMVEIVEHAMALTQFHGEAADLGDPRTTLGRVLAEACAFAAERSGRLPEVAPETAHPLRGDPGHHVLALVELLKAAALLCPPDREILLACPEPHRLEITIPGATLGPEEIGNIFSILGPRNAQMTFYELGFGPCVAHQVLNYLGVRLTTRSGPEAPGIVFRLDFRQTDSGSAEE
jgi:two-component system, sensor histidine kinase and response regulator